MNSRVLQRTELSSRYGVVLTVELVVEGVTVYETFLVFDGVIIAHCHDKTSGDAVLQHISFVNAHEKLERVLKR